MYLFQDGSFCIFNYFVLSPLVFLINFVTEIIGADGGREEDGADMLRFVVILRFAFFLTWWKSITILLFIVAYIILISLSAVSVNFRCIPTNYTRCKNDEITWADLITFTTCSSLTLDTLLPRSSQKPNKHLLVLQWLIPKVLATTLNTNSRLMLGIQSNASYNTSDQGCSMQMNNKKTINSVKTTSIIVLTLNTDYKYIQAACFVLMVMF